MQFSAYARSGAGLLVVPRAIGLRSREVPAPGDLADAGDHAREPRARRFVGGRAACAGHLAQTTRRS